MPIPNDPQPAPVVSSRVLELGSLFAAPLVSVIEADVLAAKEFTRFLYDFGFVTDGSEQPQGGGDHLGALRTVSFTYKRPGPNGTLEDAVVQIPLLSLVPLPLLQVTDAEFTFNVRVLESESSTLGAPPPLLERPGGAPTPTESASGVAARPRIRAMLAQSPTDSPAQSGKRQSELDANMAVKLSMRQADVPAGISALLNLMSQSIHSRSES